MTIYHQVVSLIEETIRHHFIVDSDFNVVVVDCCAVSANYDIIALFIVNGLVELLVSIVVIGIVIIIVISVLVVVMEHVILAHVVN